MSDLDDFVDGAQRLADAARPVVLPLFRSGVGFEVKPDASPVTAADRAAEAAMREIIADRWPQHGVLGEEHGADRIDAEYVWVLDPIDGTKSFVTGKPLFGTLIALMRDGRPLLGVIDMPALDQRWVGAEGRATTLNGMPVRTRSCDDLRSAWLYATSPQMFEGARAPAFQRLSGRCYAAVWGADCYAYGLLASGRVDVVCEAKMQPYDYCALVPVVTGAGGAISDWRGEALGLGSDGTVLAAGDPRAHRAARDALAG